MQNSKVIISPWSKKMRNGKENPKNYPYWKEVISELRSKNIEVIQTGIEGEALLDANSTAFGLSLEDLAELVKSCNAWASVDNFFQHFCYNLKKPGVVIFGKSDPNIFGHDLNENLLKDRSYLRAKQFNFWEDVEYSTDCFVGPEVVSEAILRRISNGN
jgi:ADP-heptose:LPS heptosyltransferase